jgi:hypothetical protein
MRQVNQGPRNVARSDPSSMLLFGLMTYTTPSSRRGVMMQRREPGSAELSVRDMNTRSQTLLHTVLPHIHVGLG